MLKDVVYFASRTKDGGIFKYSFQKSRGYVKEKFFPADSPMYMIIGNRKMHILLRAPFENSQSGYSSCRIDENGDLYDFSNAVSTKGEIACHLTEFKNNIFCVNYASGDVTKIGGKTLNHNNSGLPLSHPHFIGATPDRKYLAVTDLGQDLIYLYDEDLNCKNKISLPSKHGVRHLAFSRNGKYVFTANELKSTVSVLEYSGGDMRLLDTESCKPCNFHGESYASAIRIYKNDIFVANRGHNSISKLSFSGEKLHFVSCFDCRGKTPRDFIFHNNKILCANQESDSITVFEETDNGKFEFIQQIDIKEPICVVCGEE